MQLQAHRNLIDTLAVGFGTIHRRIALLLIPIAVDVFLWVGPKLTLGPLFGLGADPRLDSEGLFGLLSIVNIWVLLTIQLPSFVGPASPDVASATGLGALHNWFIAFPVIVILAGSGILVACVYRGFIGNAIRGESPPANILMVRTIMFWTRFGIIAVAIPSASLFAAYLAQVGGGIVLALLMGPFLVAAFYLFFTIDALFMSRVGPVDAFRFANLVIQRFFRPALGLFLLVTLISLGMAIFWSNIAASSVGVVIAIIGNAYIATGLTAASMVFYQDRILLIQQQEG